MPRFTDLTNGQPVVINPAHVVYVEPGGNDTYTNVYLATHGMKKVKESIDVVEAELFPVIELATVEAIEFTEIDVATDDEAAAAAAADALKAALNESGSRDEGDPQQRETPAGSGKNKNKNQQQPEPSPAGPPEKKAETESGES